MLLGNSGYGCIIRRSRQPLRLAIGSMPELMRPLRMDSDTVQLLDVMHMTIRGMPELTTDALRSRRVLCVIHMTTRGIPEPMIHLAIIRTDALRSHRTPDQSLGALHTTIRVIPGWMRPLAIIHTDGNRDALRSRRIPDWFHQSPGALHTTTRDMPDRMRPLAIIHTDGNRDALRSRRLPQYPRLLHPYTPLGVPL